MKISKLDKNKENTDEPTISGLCTKNIRIIHSSVNKMEKINYKVKYILNLSYLHPFIKLNNIVTILITKRYKNSICKQ